MYRHSHIGIDTRTHRRTCTQTPAHGHPVCVCLSLSLSRVFMGYTSVSYWTIQEYVGRVCACACVSTHSSRGSRSVHTQSPFPPRTCSWAHGTHRRCQSWCPWVECTAGSKGFRTQAVRPVVPSARHTHATHGRTRAHTHTHRHRHSCPQAHAPTYRHEHTRTPTDAGPCTLTEARTHPTHPRERADLPSSTWR
jgi:hypothetical protein